MSINANSPLALASSRAAPKPGKVTPRITITRTGKALICQIGAKFYKIISLQRMFTGSNQWQNMDIDDPAAAAALDALASSVERLVNRIGPEQFDLRGAKSFQVLTKRKVSTDGKLPPFTFHELVWKPSGAEERVHFKLKFENFDPVEHSGLESGMASVGRGFAEAIKASKVKISSSKSKEKKKPKSIAHPQEFMTNMLPDGNCLLHSIAHQLPYLSAEKKDALSRQVDYSIDIDALHRSHQLVSTLRTQMAKYVSNAQKFRDDIHLTAIIEAVREERDILKLRHDGAVSQSEKNSLLPQLKALNNVLNLETANQSIAIIQAYANYIQNDGIYLDQVAIEALTDILDLPIATIEPEVQRKKTGPNPKDYMQEPTGNIQISECFLPPQPALGDPRGIEDPETLFVYYHGRGDEGKHYDHVNPAHQQTRVLVQQHKESCIAKLGRILGACDGRDQQADVNYLCDPISVIRKYYPELIPQIHAYLASLSIFNLDAGNDDDIAQMLLEAKALQAFDFNTIQALIQPKVASPLLLTGGVNK